MDPNDFEIVDGDVTDYAPARWAIIGETLASMGKGEAMKYTCKNRAEADKVAASIRSYQKATNGVIPAFKVKRRQECVYVVRE